MSNTKQVLTFSVLSILFFQTSIHNEALIKTIFPEAHRYEDFTTFTEIDPADVISVNQSHVRWDHMDRSFNCSVFKSHGVGIGFFGDFEHQFEFRLNTIEAGDSSCRQILKLYRLSVDLSGKPRDHITFYPEQLGSTDDRFLLVFWQRSGDEKIFVFVGDSVYSTRKTYYVTISRTGDICRLKVYADPERTNLIDDSGDQTGVKTEYEYLIVANGRDFENDPNDWSTGYIANLALLESTQFESKITFNIIPNPATVGETVTFSGILFTEFSQPIANEDVHLYARPLAGSWRYVTSITTNTYGEFIWQTKIPLSGIFVFAVYYPGSKKYCSSYNIASLIVQ